MSHGSLVQVLDVAVQWCPARVFFERAVETQEFHPQRRELLAGFVGQRDSINYRTVGHAARELEGNITS